MAVEGATVIGKVAIKVIPDTDDFRRDAKRKLDQIERALGDIEIGFDISNLSKRKVQAELDVLARRRTVDFAPKVNKVAATKVANTLAALSGGRGLSQIGTDFGNYIGELDRNLPKIAGTALAVANLGSAALTSSANLLSLGSSLASTAGAGLALPGILGGIAFGLGASVAVLKDFNQRLPEVGDKLHDLQDRMSDRFWNVAEAPIRKLVDSLLPELSRGLEGTSTSLGGFFANLAGSSRNVFNGELDSMFADLSESIDIASGKTDVFVGIIAKLGSVGAGNLPRLAKWVGDVGTQFDGWLASQGEAGLQGFVDEGISALKDLGGVLQGTGSLLAGLSSAAEASGATTLATLERTVRGAAEVVNRPTFQNALRNAFAGAREGLDELTGRSGDEFEGFMLRLSDVLAKSLPKAGKAAGNALGGIFDALDQPAVQDAVLGFFDNLNEVVDDLRPTLPKVAKALSAVLDTVGSVATNLSGALAPALDTLAPAVTGLSDDLEPLINQLGNLLVNAVEIASPVVSELAGEAGFLAGQLALVLTPVNGLIDLMQKLPSPVKDATGKLVTIGLTIAAATWFGSIVRTKIATLGTELTIMSGKAGVAGVQVAKAGALATTAAGKLTTARLGIAGAGIALGTIASNAAGSNTKLNILAQGGAAAMTGFAIGGPWGGAIGFAGGALAALATAGDQTNQSLKDATPTADTFAASLDRVTLAATEQTRALVKADLQQEGLISQASRAGVSARELISATLGNKDANEHLTTSLNDQIQRLQVLENRNGALTTAQQEQMDAALKVVDSLPLQQSYYKELAEAARAARNDTGDLTAVLDKLSNKKAAARIDLLGFPETKRKLAELAATYKLSDKDLRIIIRESGLKVTVDGVKKLRTNLEDVKNARPDLKPYKLSFETQAETLAREAKEKANGTAAKYAKALSSGNPDLSPVKNSLLTQLGNINGPARAAGSALGNAVVAGAESALSVLAGKATDKVRNAFAAAQAVLGSFGGGGKGGGGKDDKNGKFQVNPRLISKQADLIADLFAEQFSKTLDKRLSKIQSLFDKALSKAGKSGAKRARAEFGAEIKEYQGLIKQHEALMRQYDAATARLKKWQDAQDALTNSVKETVIATSDPTTFGAVTYDGIVRGLQAARDKAVAFSKVIKELIKSGLNKTTLQQILSAGPEAGLATAQAILNGGVSQINAIQAQINAAAQGVGDAAGQHFFGDLVASAQGDVDALIEQLVPLQQRLRKFARDLIRALNDELGKAIKNGGKGGGGLNAEVVLPGTKKVLPTAVKTAEGGTAGGTYVAKQLNYIAAPGSSSFSAEEDFFAAASRARGGI